MTPAITARIIVAAMATTAPTAPPTIAGIGRELSSPSSDVGGPSIVRNQLFSKARVIT